MGREKGDLWRQLRKETQGRRAVAQQHYAAKIEQLAVAGQAEVERLNEHAWRLRRGAVVVDYWPRTGTWLTPGTELQRRRGHGWRSLLALLGVQEAACQS